MMKLVVSFDEMGLAFNETNMLADYGKIRLYLEEQFPQWDIEQGFDLRSMNIDWECKEFSIDMRTV
jgi:hypothetical protein